MKTLVLDREAMMEWLEDQLSSEERGMRFVRETEYLNGVEGGIWLSADDQDEWKGRIIYDYWCSDIENYTFGVLNEWEAELDKRGWYSQWRDPGTVCLYPNW